MHELNQSLDQSNVWQSIGYTPFKINSNNNNKQKGTSHGTFINKSLRKATVNRPKLYKNRTDENCSKETETLLY